MTGDLLWEEIGISTIESYSCKFILINAEQ